MEMFLVTSKLMSEVLVAETDEDALINSRIKNRLIQKIERVSSEAVLCFHNIDGSEKRVLVEDYLQQNQEPHSVGIILKGESRLTIE